MDGARDSQLAGRCGDPRALRSCLCRQRRTQGCKRRIRRASARLLCRAYPAHRQTPGRRWKRCGSWIRKRSSSPTSPIILNHPPIFYALLAALGPKLEGHPQAIMRIVCLMSHSSPSALPRCSDRAHPQFSRLEFYAYAIPLALHSNPGAARRRGHQRQSRLSRRRAGDARAWQLVATGRGLWLACALVGVVAGRVGEADRTCCSPARW